MTDMLLFLFEFLGTVAFAVSGAVTGLSKRMDIFGILVLAVVVAVGLGLIEGIEDAGKLINADKTFTPNKENKAVYDKMFAAYKELHAANKNIFKMLNG